jgi:hypothetical protein
MRQQALPVLGKSHATGTPVEQAGPDQGLECRDLPGYCRLCITELLGSRRNGATLGHSIEGSQLLDIHAQ